MMTEVRKKIAELIGVKLRKTDQGIIEGVEYIILNPDQYVDNDGIVRKITQSIEYIYDFENPFEYDITAVFLYLNSKKYKKNYKGNFDYLNPLFNIEISDDIYIDNDNGKLFPDEGVSFPNKPLILYTETEDELLLDLLINIITNE